MRSRPTRTLSVGTTPVNIRKTAASANDPDAYPVTFSVLRYPSGGGTVSLFSESQGLGPDAVVDEFYTDSKFDQPMIDMARHAFMVKGNTITQVK